MPLAGLALLTLVASVVAFRARLDIAFATVVAAIYLVPGTLAVPGNIGVTLLVLRLVLVAFAAGMVVRVRRGEVPLDAFRPLRIHAALVIFALVMFVNGVALAANDIPTEASLAVWYRTLDQLILLTTAVATARVLGPARVARVVVAVLAVTAVIAIGEHVTEGSWSRWWFQGVSDQQNQPGAFALAERGDEVRVRAAAQFALEYGWVVAMLLPLAWVWATRQTKRAALAVPALLGLAVVWSYSRSALAAIAAGAVVLLVLSRADRAVRRLLLPGLLVVGLVVLAVPSLREPFQAAGETGEAQIRADRLPEVLAVAADRPVHGLGLAGLAHRAIRTTDISYLLVYAELGVVGLVAYAVLLVTALLSALWAALRAPPGEPRALAAAAATGILLGIFAGLAYDVISVPQSTSTLWILVAIAIAAGELSPAPARRAAVPVGVRAALVPAGVAGGFAILALVPMDWTTTWHFTALSDRQLAAAAGPRVIEGRVLSETVCQTAGAVDRVASGDIDCRRLEFGRPLASLRGDGEIRLTEHERPAVVTLATTLRRSIARTVPSTSIATRSPLERARPTWAATAPVWFGSAAMAAAILLPGAVRRRTTSSR